MQVPCSRMKIQAISIAFESAKRNRFAVSLPARPNRFAVSGKRFAVSRAGPARYVADSQRPGPPQSLPARPEAALRPIAREAPG